jgi:hypothetical protein
MIDDLATASPSRTGKSPPATRQRWRDVGGPGPGLILLILLFSAFGAGTLAAHETIDIERANVLVAAADGAVALTKSAAGPGPEGEARFVLGMVLVEATDILNRDLAAHSGRLTVNAELMLKALAQRGLAPRLDETIGRYRLPTTPLEEAIRLSPEAPYAPRARFALLKAHFYESFVLDPFELIGIGFNELERQIAESEALAPALSSADDAEEASFIQAVDLARAARLAAAPEVARAYASKARKALTAFADAYPDSMRAAAAGMILKSVDGAK